MIDFKRWNFEVINGELHACKDNHEKGQPCEYEPLPAEKLLSLIEGCRNERNALAAHMERFKRVMNSAFGELTEAYNNGFTHGNCRGRIIKALEATPQASLNALRREVLMDLAKELKEVGGHVGVNYKFIEQRANKRYPDKE